jgi:hypothetical protein
VCKCVSGEPNPDGTRLADDVRNAIDSAWSGLVVVAGRPTARRRRIVRRIVVRAERAVAGVATPAEQLHALGLSVSGTVEAVHPRSGARRVTAWIGR